MQERRLYYLGRVADGVGENVLPEPAADGAVHAVRRHLLLHHHLPADPGSPAQRIASNSFRISPRVGGIRPEKAWGNGNRRAAALRLPGIGEEEDALQHSAVLRGWARRGGARILGATGGRCRTGEKKQEQWNEGEPES